MSYFKLIDVAEGLLTSLRELESLSLQSFKGLIDLLESLRLLGLSIQQLNCCLVKLGVLHDVLLLLAVHLLKRV